LFEFRALTRDDVRKILERAATYVKESFSIEVSQNVLDIISDMSEGDARRALNLVEVALLVAGKEAIPVIDEIGRAHV